MRVLSSTLRRHGPAIALAALLGTSGVLHLRRPGIFRPLIPRSLGNPDPWVLGSGVAEIACAAALTVPADASARRAGVGGPAGGVFPGNVTMAVRSRPDARGWAGQAGGGLGAAAAAGAAGRLGGRRGRAALGSLRPDR